VGDYGILSLRTCRNINKQLHLLSFCGCSRVSNIVECV